MSLSFYAKTVTLAEVRLNHGANMADSMAFQNVTEFKVATTQSGEVRALANGRLRAVKRSARPSGAQFKFELCNRTQIDWLRDKVGELVCFRDDRGRKIWGIYWAAPVTENITRVEYGDVEIEFHEVSHSEDS